MTSPVTVPVDIAAVLAALQDQIDDLTTLVESQRRALVRLEERVTAAERTASDSRT